MAKNSLGSASINLEAVSDDDMAWISGKASPSSGAEITVVPLSCIVESDRLRLRRPPYPRVDELAEDIKRRGQTTPVFLRPIGGNKYEVIAGHRRRAALEKIGAETALARIFSSLSDDDAYDLALSENQERDDLTDLEIAEICMRLQKEGKTYPEIATRMGWGSEKNVKTYLRIARESDEKLQEFLHRGDVTTAVALSFLEAFGSDFPKDMRAGLYETAIERGCSSRDVKALVAKARRAIGRTDAADDVEDDAASAEASPIKHHKRGGFSVSLRFEAKNLEGIDRGIDALQEALKEARSLRKKTERILKLQEEASA